MRRWGRITSWQRIWWNFASADWRELHFIPRLVAQDIEQNTAVDRTTFSKRSPARSGLHWDLRQIGWGVRPSTFADRASQVIFGMDTSQYYLFAVLGPDNILTIYGLYITDLICLIAFLAQPHRGHSDTTWQGLVYFSDHISTTFIGHIVNMYQPCKAKKTPTANKPKCPCSCEIQRFQSIEYTCSHADFDQKQQMCSVFLGFDSCHVVGKLLVQ